jgi:hypothetical protein
VTAHCAELRQDTQTTEPILKLLLRLEECSSAPPVLFFLRTIDLWSIRPIAILSDFLGSVPYQHFTGNVGDTQVLFCLTDSSLSLIRALQNQLRAIRRTSSFEMQQLFSHLIQCLRSWRTLLHRSEIQSAVVVSSTTIGPSWLDEDIRRLSAVSLPLMDNGE